MWQAFLVVVFANFVKSQFLFQGTYKAPHARKSQKIWVYPTSTVGRMRPYRYLNKRAYSTYSTYNRYPFYTAPA